MDASLIGFLAVNLEGSQPLQRSLIGHAATALAGPNAWQPVKIKLTNQTLILTARNAFQTLTLGSKTVASTDADQEIRIWGTGDAVVGPGWWDRCAIVDGNYTGAFFHGGMESDVATTHNDIYRRIDGGPWVPIASQVAKQSTVLDPLPSLNGRSEYRATAVSSLPSSADSNILEERIAEPGWCYANYGNGFSAFLRIWGNMKLAGAIKREKEFHRYAGRKRRVVTFGEPVDLNLSIAGRITPDASSLYEWEALEAAGEIICWRDPKGRRTFGVLDGISYTHTHPRLVDVSFTVEEIDYAEPTI